MKENLDNNKLIKSISVKHYRGFKEEQTLELADFNHFTFLTGPNNSGKSALTQLFKTIYDDPQNLEITLKEDFPKTTFFDCDTIKNEIEINIEISPFLVSNNWKNEIIISYLKSTKITLCIKFIKHKKSIFRYCWVRFDNEDSYIINSENNLIYNHETTLEQLFKKTKDEHQTESTCRSLATNILQKIKDSLLSFNALRNFNIEETTHTVTGKSLINWLKNEELEDEVKSIHDKINTFFSELNLDFPVIHINQNDDIIFNFNGLKLKYHELGTGYSMLYILLVEILRSERDELIVIIDEPESHLHAGLIHQLMDILRKIEINGKQKKIQYIIATHSPSVFSSLKNDDHLYRFKKEGQECSFEKLFNDKNTKFSEILDICNDLGIKPSDSLLSNCVIWVEGPTEVKWIRKLLYIYFQEHNLNFIEGMHYSILMTGGNLIKHFSFGTDRNESEEKLSITRVNPNCYVIVDGDNTKNKEGKHQRSLQIATELNGDSTINNKKEANKLKNFWWTEAKELENYYPPELINEFYIEREKTGSTLKDISLIENWEVYGVSKQDGKVNSLRIQDILDNEKKHGIKNNKNELRHKLDLSKHILDNLTFKHISDKTDRNIDLLNNLKKLVDYIAKVNKPNLGQNS